MLGGVPCPSSFGEGVCIAKVAEDDENGMGDIAVEGSGDDVFEGGYGEVADRGIWNIAQASKKEGGGSRTEKKCVVIVVSHERMDVWNRLGDVGGVLIPVLSDVVGRRLMVAAA